MNAGRARADEANAGERREARAGARASSAGPAGHAPPDAPRRPGRRALAAAMLVAAAAATVAALPGVWARATYGAQVSADEPHYLLTAISLAEDGDLDVSDELAAERWRDFHEVGLAEQAAPRPDGTRVSPHDPLLPALLAPGVAVGGWVGAKVTLVVVAAATAALTVWTAVRRFGARPWPAAVVVATLTASWPLAGYATQVYPEMPAALATLAGVAVLPAITRPDRAGRHATAALGTVVVVLPWLGVKYSPVAAVLAVLGLWRLVRGGARRRAAALALGWGLAAVAYAALHVGWYGGLSVYASGTFFERHGGQMSVVGTEIDLPGRTRRLVGLLVDRRFGLAAWQPLWLAGVAAVPAVARRRDGVLLWAPLLAAWVTATWVAVTMHGWWVPGRQVVVALPLAAVAMAALVSRRPRWTWAAVGAGLLGVVSYVALVRDALAGRIAWIVDFWEVGDPWYGAWRTVLPDHMRMAALDWWLTAAWAALLAALAVGVARGGAGSGRGRKPGRRPSHDLAGAARAVASDPSH